MHFVLFSSLPDEGPSVTLDRIKKKLADSIYDLIGGEEDVKLVELSREDDEIESNDGILAVMPDAASAALVASKLNLVNILPNVKHKIRAYVRAPRAPAPMPLHDFHTPCGLRVFLSQACDYKYVVDQYGELPELLESVGVVVHGSGGAGSDRFSEACHSSSFGTISNNSSGGGLRIDAPPSYFNWMGDTPVRDVRLGNLLAWLRKNPELPEVNGFSLTATDVATFLDKMVEVLSLARTNAMRSQAPAPATTAAATTPAATASIVTPSGNSAGSPMSHGASTAAFGSTTTGDADGPPSPITSSSSIVRRSYSDVATQSILAKARDVINAATATPRSDGASSDTLTPLASPTTIASTGGGGLPPLLGIRRTVSYPALHTLPPHIQDGRGFLFGWYLAPLSGRLRENVYKGWDFVRHRTVIIKITKSVHEGEKESRLLRAMTSDYAPELIHSFLCCDESFTAEEPCGAHSSTSGASGHTTTTSAGIGSRGKQHRRSDATAAGYAVIRRTVFSSDQLCDELHAFRTYSSAIFAATGSGSSSSKGGHANTSNSSNSMSTPPLSRTSMLSRGGRSSSSGDVTLSGSTGAYYGMRQYYHQYDARLQCVLVMEAADGGSLDGINYTDPKELFVDACNVLQCVQNLHRLNYVHCDLKPQNFVKSYGRVKLIDFGSALLKGEELPRNYTIAYVAPELAVLKDSLLHLTSPACGPLSAPALAMPSFSLDGDSPTPTAATASCSPTEPGNTGSMLQQHQHHSHSRSASSSLPASGSAAASARRKGVVNESLDVWGIGATLYHMFTGRPLWVEGTPLRVIMSGGVDLTPCTCATADSGNDNSHASAHSTTIIPPPPPPPSMSALARSASDSSAASDGPPLSLSLPLSASLSKRPSTTSIGSGSTVVSDTQGAAAAVTAATHTALSSSGGHSRAHSQQQQQYGNIGKRRTTTAMSFAVGNSGNGFSNHPDEDDEDDGGGRFETVMSAKQRRRLVHEGRVKETRRANAGAGRSTRRQLRQSSGTAASSGSGVLAAAAATTATAAAVVDTSAPVIPDNTPPKHGGLPHSYKAALAPHTVTTTGTSVSAAQSSSSVVLSSAPSATSAAPTTATRSPSLKPLLSLFQPADAATSSLLSQSVTVTPAPPLPAPTHTPSRLRAVIPPPSTTTPAPTAGAPAASTSSYTRAARPSLCGRCGKLFKTYAHLLNFLLRQRPGDRHTTRELQQRSFFNPPQDVTLRQRWLDVVAFFADIPGYDSLGLLREVRELMFAIPPQARDILTAARVPEDICNALRGVYPRIIQFSCHAGVDIKQLQQALQEKRTLPFSEGAVGGDLVFCNSERRLAPLNAAVLGDILKEFAGTHQRLECIFLNGCNTSKMSAELLLDRELTCRYPHLRVIGWASPVENKAAVQFTRSFYDEIAMEKRTIEIAFAAAVEGMAHNFWIGVPPQTPAAGPFKGPHGVPFLMKECVCGLPDGKQPCVLPCIAPPPIKRHTLIYQRFRGVISFQYKSAKH